MTEKENDIDSEEGRYYDPELVDSGCPHNSDCNDCSAFVDKVCTLSFKEYDNDHSDIVNLETEERGIEIQDEILKDHFEGHLD